MKGRKGKGSEQMESAANFSRACMASALFFRRTIRFAAEIRDTCHPNSPPPPPPPPPCRSYIVFLPAVNPVVLGWPKPKLK